MWVIMLAFRTTFQQHSGLCLFLAFSNCLSWNISTYCEKFCKFFFGAFKVGARRRPNKCEYLIRSDDSISLMNYFEAQIFTQRFQDHDTQKLLDFVSIYICTVFGLLKHGANCWLFDFIGRHCCSWVRFKRDS